MDLAHLTALTLGLATLALAVVVLVNGLFCLWLAREKGYGMLNWFLLGVIFGPIALIALAGAPDHSP